MKTIVCFLLALLSSSFALASDTELRLAEQQIFRLTNEARKDAGVEPLQWNEQAAVAARAHAKLMAQNQALSHQFSGEPPLHERLGATGLRFDAAAENVADAASADEAHEALMNSPPHRQNLLNPKYNSLGIGVAQNGGQIYVTQDFAHSISDHTATEVEDGISPTSTGCASPMDSRKCRRRNRSSYESSHAKGSSARSMLATS